MVSFDFTSLYTNVPIKDTLLIVKDLLVNDPDLPASSIIAEIYMQAHEGTALTTTHPPKVCERHVDGVFFIIKKSYLNDFFEHVNNLHPKIKFTIEKENDSCLPFFLDTLIKRNQNGSLSIFVYGKPMHTDQYLNFNLNHQIRAKESVVSALFTRADNIVSDAYDLRIENEQIVNVLMSNDYSRNTITKVRRNIAKRKPDNVTDQEPEEPVGHVNLPYIVGTSEILKRIFQKHKIRCTFYASDALRKVLSKPKDKIEMGKQNNIVYKIPCGDCDAVYIGESK